MKKILFNQPVQVESGFYAGQTVIVKKINSKEDKYLCHLIDNDGRTIETWINAYDLSAKDTVNDVLRDM